MFTLGSEAVLHGIVEYAKLKYCQIQGEPVAGYGYHQWNFDCLKVLKCGYLLLNFVTVACILKSKMSVHIARMGQR